MSTNSIRPIVICVFWRGDEILVYEEFVPADNYRFYRPFGGGTEFGERHAEAVVREIREELNAEICNAHYLDCMEYLYRANGRSYHEIIFIYEADFVDASF
ncbi:MAG: NUDIX domain-containing protein, partial [Chloroflexota bacterium]